MYKVNVKWGKNKYVVELNTAENVFLFKSALFALTGVQPERQKITGTKGLVKDDTNWSTLGIKDGTIFMLIGTADELPQPPATPTLFDDDPFPSHPYSPPSPPPLVELLFELMAAKEYVVFSGVSKSIFHCIRAKIEATLTFSIPVGMEMKMFRPQNVIMRTCNKVPPSTRNFTLICDNSESERVYLPTFRPRVPPSRPPLRSSVRPQFGPHFRDFHLLPATLTNITIINYNGPVDLLPKKLTNLSTDKNFNEVVDSLPPALTHLTLGRSFRQSLDVLPPNLTHLTIKSNLRRPINSAVPITHLNTMYYVPGCNIPSSVTYLEVYKFDNGEKLPPSITHLIIHFCELPLSAIASPGLVSLHLPQIMHPHDSFPTLPSLTQLTIGTTRNTPIDVDNFPPSLTHLALGDVPYYCDPAAPSSFPLQWTLRDDILYGKPTADTISAGNLGFDQPINNLPCSLTHLTLGNYFDQPINHLPSTLTHLTLGNQFDHPVDNLPPRLSHLKLGNSFNQPIDKLPAILVSLKLGASFHHPIDNLPTSLIVLYLHSTFCNVAKVSRTVCVLRYSSQ